MGFLNLTLSTIVYPQILQSPGKFQEHMHRSGQAKHLAFPFARGWVGRINQHCTATHVLVYSEVRKAQSEEDPHSSPGCAPDPLSEARVTRLLSWAAPPSSSSQASPSPAAPPWPLSNTGKAMQLQFPDFCLQLAGREHLQLITMCFGLYAKPGFYHCIFCCGDFPHTCHQAGPSSLGCHILQSCFTRATQWVNA